MNESAADVYAELANELRRKIDSGRASVDTLIDGELRRLFHGQAGNGLLSGLAESANVGRREIAARRKMLKRKSGSRPLSPTPFPVNGERGANLGAQFIDYSGPNIELDYFRLQSFTISGIEDQTLLNQLKSGLARVLSGEISYSEWQLDANNLLDGFVEASRIATIARTNLQTAINAGRYFEQMAAVEDLPFLEYVTVGDDFVRDEHRKLDGKVWRKDDPIWDTIYPPNDYNCRCSAQEHDAFSMEAEGKSLERGYENFKDNEIPKIPSGFARSPKNYNQLLASFASEANLQKLSVDDYGLGELKDWTTNAGSRKLTAARGETIKDYEGRVRTVQAEINDKEFDLVRQTVESPAEVWGFPGESLKYISRFGERTVVVTVLGEITGVEFAQDDSARTGLLMHRRAA